jgi:hypothetical protein
MKDKMYTVEIRDDKRDNSLCSLSVFTRLTSDCMLVRFPYLLGMQAASILCGTVLCLYYQPFIWPIWLSRISYNYLAQGTIFGKEY